MMSSGSMDHLRQRATGPRGSSSWAPLSFLIHYSPFSILIIALLFSGCYEEDTVATGGLDFFPVEIGHWAEYEVDSVWMDEPAGILGSGETHYLLRELNESTFMDEGGREVVRVERSRRADTAAAWQIKDIWGRVRTQAEAEQNEDNVILRKLIFPLQDGREWNGTLRTTDQNLQEWTGFLNIPVDWPFVMSAINEPYTINGLTFDSTVTVTQYDAEVAFGISLVSREVYARHVGLVHRHMTVYNIQPDPDSLTDKDSIGYTFEQRITGFAQ
jgi:hypothetical protein